ncbi:MAG TPA: hypothetical protein VKE94_16625 [Gemmataceae bacterium]|nr:hypothetical protein [Gemmataceae bacterium]
MTENDGDTMACPYCGRDIYDDAERCPYCENYLSREDAPARHSPWIVVGVVLALAAAAYWILR